MSASLLLVEDTASLAVGLVGVLRLKGYSVQHVVSGEEALAQLAESTPDLMILDAGLPGISGFEVLRQLRSHDAQLPVLMLTAHGDEVDRVLGFELGVDDYVTKPFSVAELLGRIAALLRRSGLTAVRPNSLRFGPVTVDLERFAASTPQGEVALPARACDILRVLSASAGQTLTRDQVMDRVWGEGEAITPKTLHNLVARLRGLIEPDPEQPCYLKTVHGVGYRLDL